MPLFLLSSYRFCSVQTYCETVIAAQPPSNRLTVAVAVILVTNQTAERNNFGLNRLPSWTSVYSFVINFGFGCLPIRAAVFVLPSATRLPYCGMARAGGREGAATGEFLDPTLVSVPLFFALMMLLLLAGFHYPSPSSWSIFLV